MCNPTVFKITHIRDPRLRRLDAFHRDLLKEGPLYGSYYRPGEYWTEEVFVCPRCVHATSSEIEPGDEGRYYCKYCDNHWQIGEGRLLLEVHDWDDDGNPIDTRLI